MSHGHKRHHSHHTPPAPLVPQVPMGPTGLGRGEPAVDLNGTVYTKLEGRAGDKNISIQYVDPHFDPLRTPGIALTTAQATQLGVRVGESVLVHDTKSNSDTPAVYYDNAGSKPASHFEVNPALADILGLNYHNKKGNVRDSVKGSENMLGRFDIRRQQ